MRALCKAQGILDLGGEELSVAVPNMPSYDKWLDWRPDSPELVMPNPGTVDIDVFKAVRRHISARGILENETVTLLSNHHQSNYVVSVDLCKKIGDALGLVILPAQTSSAMNVEDPASNAIACSIDAQCAKAKPVLDPSI